MHAWQLQNLRSFSKERQAQITTLERRVSELEMQLRESEHKAQQLHSEKSQMAQEIKAMQRDMSKLDQFKRSIMQSIHDDETEPLGRRPAYDLNPAPAPRAYAPSPPQSASASPPVPVATMPRYTGSASAASSPAGTAYPPSAPGAVPLPAADGGAAHLDGKDFFRQARLRLTYEQFNQFLSNIKRLNDHAQTCAARVTQQERRTAAGTAPGGQTGPSERQGL